MLTIFNDKALGDRSDFLADKTLNLAGEDAITATEELLAIQGITGNYTVNSDNSEDVKKETMIATIDNMSKK